MQKTAIATVLAALFPLGVLAQAPSNPPANGSIEAYGIVDLGVERQDVGSASVTRLSSGITSGSRFGLRGREPLSPGYIALFTLEIRAEADTGGMGNRNPVYYCGTGLCPGVTVLAPATALPAPNQAAILGGSSAVNAALLSAVTTVNSANALFDRQSFVGLITPVGGFILGRQYTPGYEILNKYNSFHDSMSGQFTQGYSGLTIRANNAVHYRVELGGFAASLMYGFGGTDAIRSERTTDPRRGDDFVGINAQYVAPKFSVGIAQNRNKTVTYADPTQAKTGLVTTHVGGTFTTGPVKFFAQYMHHENKNPVLRPEDIQALVISTGGNLTAITNILGALYINPTDMDMMRGVAGATDTKAYHLGAQWTVSTGVWHFAYNHAKDTARTSWVLDDATVNHYGVGYFHTLSRRTQLFGAYSIAKNGGSSRMGLGAAGYSGGFATATNESVSAMQVGIRHYF